MREIKFRVKIKGDAGIYKVWQIDWLNQRVYAYRACGYEWVPFNKIQSLMQWTGLRDCKRTEEYPEGQDIYEGDMVRCWGGEHYQGYWEYDNEMTVQNMINDCFMMGEYENIKVIGNIYEKEKSTCETEAN